MPALPGQSRLHVVPLSWKQACLYVTKFHRHHKAPRGQKWAIGAVDDTGELRGVATCGRPVARHYDDGGAIEINRTCTEGFPNVNSFLLGACWKIAAAMGYCRILTYTEEGESGVSLRAAGYEEQAKRPARESWAESSVKLRSLRDPVGVGGKAGVLWMKQTASEPNYA